MQLVISKYDRTSKKLKSLNNVRHGKLSKTAFTLLGKKNRFNYFLSPYQFYPDQKMNYIEI